MSSRMKIFFNGRGNEMRRAHLLQLLYQHRFEDVVVTYRGIDTAFIRSRQDDDTAFEVTRKTKSVVGEDSAKSRIIAAIPQKLVKILMEENNQSEPVGVFVEGVDGEFRSSRDGDFIIRSSDSNPDKSWPYDHDEVEEAEVVCASGNFKRSNGCKFYPHLMKRGFNYPEFDVTRRNFEGWQLQSEVSAIKPPSLIRFAR